MSDNGCDMCYLIPEVGNARQSVSQEMEDQPEYLDQKHKHYIPSTHPNNIFLIRALKDDF